MATSSLAAARPPHSRSSTISEGASPTDTQSPISLEEKASVEILIIDDEHTLRESCATLLKSEGYTVTVSARGDEGRILLDRKSTRLNSSHVAISSAVICSK